MLNAEQQVIIHELNKRATMEELEQEGKSETKDQIIVSLMYELVEASPKTYTRGKKLNKTQFAQKCSVSQMSLLF